LEKARDGIVSHDVRERNIKDDTASATDDRVREPKHAPHAPAHRHAWRMRFCLVTEGPDGLHDCGLVKKSDDVANQLESEQVFRDVTFDKLPLHVGCLWFM
jgi:hypothetical protein